MKTSGSHFKFSECFLFIDLIIEDSEEGSSKGGSTQCTSTASTIGELTWNRF